MTYNYAKTILGLMTRVKDDRGKVRKAGRLTRLIITWYHVFVEVAPFFFQVPN